jgi:hypothetical protein
MPKMFCPRLAINQNIIKENEYKMTKKRLKYIVHESLEGGPRVIETERHDEELI